jgi:hypothetical protein
MLYSPQGMNRLPLITQPAHAASSTGTHIPSQLPPGTLHRDLLLTKYATRPTKRSLRTHFRALLHPSDSHHALSVPLNASTAPISIPFIEQTSPNSPPVAPLTQTIVHDVTDGPRGPTAQRKSRAWSRTLSRQRGRREG